MSSCFNQKSKNAEILEKLDLEVYKNKAEIIRQTVAQVVKDFAMFGMEIIFSGNTEFAYQEMFIQLSNQVQHLLEYDSGKLSALLYQIDINEAHILESVAQHPEHSNVDIITELIIHRELKKVLFRNFYKNQKSGL